MHGRLAPRFAFRGASIFDTVRSSVRTRPSALGGNKMRRFVVTGSGIVSPLGCGTDLVWQRPLDGRSGIRRLTDNLVHDVPAKIAGVVPLITEDAEGGFDLDHVVSHKDHKRIDRFIQIAMSAADEAIAHADWVPANDRERDRTATIIGSGIGGFATMKQAVHITDERGPRKLSPFTVPSFLVNLAAGQVSIRHGFRGAIGAPVTACAAGLQAIGDGARGGEAAEADAFDAAFGAARALST